MSPIIMKAAYQTYSQKETCLKKFEIEKKSAFNFTLVKSVKSLIRKSRLREEIKIIGLILQSIHHILIDLLISVNSTLVKNCIKPRHPKNKSSVEVLGI